MRESVRDGAQKEDNEDSERKELRREEDGGERGKEEGGREMVGSGCRASETFVNSCTRVLFSVSASSLLSLSLPLSRWQMRR